MGDQQLPGTIMGIHFTKIIVGFPSPASFSTLFLRSSQGDPSQTPELRTRVITTRIVSINELP